MTYDKKPCKDKKMLGDNMCQKEKKCHQYVNMRDMQQ